MKNLFKYTFGAGGVWKYLNLPKNFFPTRSEDRGMQIFNKAKDEEEKERKTIFFSSSHFTRWDEKFIRERFSHILMHMGVNLFKFSFLFRRMNGSDISVSFGGAVRIHPHFGTESKLKFCSFFFCFIIVLANAIQTCVIYKWLHLPNETEFNQS